MFKVALIDGDNLVYNAGFAIEKTFYRLKRGDDIVQEFEPGITKTIVNRHLTDFASDVRCVTCKIIQPVHYAYHILELRMNMIMQLTLAQKYELYIGGSGKDNFRYEVAKTLPYKAGRKRRPLEYDNIRDWLVTRWNAKLVSGYETDDMLVKRHRELGEDSIICSIDKDMLQSPGWHFNIDKKTVIKVSEEEAKLNLIFQIIFGDKGDNVPGLKHLFVPRIGEKKIRKWIEDNKDELLQQEKWPIPFALTLPWYRDGVSKSQIYELYQEQLKLLTCGDI